jgi:Cu(I)/Ag(I) efflux system membrane fusion protein
LWGVLFCAVILISFLVGTRFGRSDRTGAISSLPKSAPISVEDEIEEEPPLMTPGMVQISPERQQVIGVRVGVVEKKDVVHNLRVLGRVSPDEVRVYRIVASVDGWIQQSYDNSVGTLVKKDALLATFYSPDFLDAEQAYIYSLDAVDRLKLGRRLELGRQEIPAQAAFDQLTVQRQVDILRGMGMSDSQIEKIGQTRQIMLSVTIPSPIEGFVMARNVSPGQQFLKGSELFQIADLSRVWILADVFEHEVQYFEPGLKATVRLPYQERTYQARVTAVLPIFDPDTRTLKVRLETDNPGYVLKPDMFADVELPVELGPTLTVPADSIIYSGLKKTVFVDRGHGYFEPRQIETGWRLGDRVEVIGGLMPGERIVLSGNFLIDSESRLQAVGMGIYGDMSLDPVCGMEVDQVRAKTLGLTSVFKGKTYYFCSEECKEEFDSNPEQFIEESAEIHNKEKRENQPVA